MDGEPCPSVGIFGKNPQLNRESEADSVQDTLITQEFAVKVYLLR